MVHLSRVLDHLRCINRAGLPSLQQVILQFCIGAAVTLNGTGFAVRRLVHSADARPQLHHCLHHDHQLIIRPVPAALAHLYL